MNAIAIIIVLVILVIAGYGIYAYEKKQKACPSGQSCQATSTTPPSEVYVADLGRYQVEPSSIPGFASLFGAQVATKDQLDAAQKAGAEWCYYGFVNTAKPGDPATYAAYYPMQTVRSGCGAVGVNGGSTAGAPYGVTLYGPSPRRASTAQAASPDRRPASWGGTRTPTTPPASAAPKPRPLFFCGAGIDLTRTHLTTMGGDALKLSVILATVIVLIIITLMVEGAYVGYELYEDAHNGCCCGVATKSGEYYAAPTSQKCATDYTHVAGLCSSSSCGTAGS